MGRTVDCAKGVPRPAKPARQTLRCWGERRVLRRGRRVAGHVLAVGVLVSLAGGASTLAATLTPEDTVRRYLAAVKSEKFEDAYDLISKAMKQGKSRDVWVKEQKAGMAFAEVKIFEFQVLPGKIDGDKALVPNILSSQDRFVNQLGLTEHELYTLLREEGAWRVDQQMLVEPADIPKWFGAGTPPAGPSRAAAPPLPEAPPPRH